MKCPLMFNGSMVVRAKLMETEIECLKEECAWWEKEANCCAALLIPRHLYTLERMLGMILEKMPHELQFRK